MKFRLSLIIVFCSCFFLPADVGMGGSFSYSVSTTPTSFVSFSARSDESPWCVFLNAHLEKETVSLFVDNWFINERLGSHLDYYVLWGLGLGATFDDGKRMVASGSRLGAGLDFFFSDRRIEVFAQAVCEPYYGFRKGSSSGWRPFIRPLNFPCSAGIRLWF